MKKHAFLTLFLLFSSFNAFAAELVASTGIEFLALNGQKIASSTTQSPKRLELAKGQQQVVLRYKKSLKQGSKNILFTSQPYVFDLAVAEQSLAISVPLFRSESQAKAFFHDPKFKLTEVDTQKTQIVMAEPLAGTGFAAFSDIEKAIALHNGEMPTQAATPSKAEQKSNNLLELKQWYTKASAAERQAFQDWLFEQNAN